MLTQLRSTLLRWLPAVTLMGVIFIVSSFSSSDLPNFELWDYVVKKGGHMVGYGLLALSYVHALKLEGKNFWVAWALAVLYAGTDEFHQMFTVSRHPSLIDVFVFDGGGALIALWAWARLKT